MNDNLDINPDFDLPRLTTNEMKEYELDLATWSSNNTGLTFLLGQPLPNDGHEIKSEPSSHSSAEYYDIPSNFGLKPESFPHMSTEPNPYVSAAPSNTDFFGNYNFDVKVACSKPGTQKPQVTYSQMMNKAYINMGHTLPIDFSWHPMITGLIVRATMLYSNPHDAPNLVRRCNNHKTIKTNCGDQDNSDHVLICKSYGAKYHGSLEKNVHLNVTVPLGLVQTGDTSVRVLYEFACKNSCISGMNRRGVECVFTLESAEGQVLGRRKIGIRICSCPKRDMTKEEEHEEKPLGKRRMKQSHSAGLPVDIPKQLKLGGPLDTTLYTLPPIMGHKAYKALVPLAFGVLTGIMISASAEDQEKLQPCLAEYEKLMNELSKKPDA